MNKPKVAKAAKWNGGTIEIIVDRKWFTSGSTVKGKIALKQDKDFDGTELMVGLLGTEVNYFRRVNADEDTVYHDKHVLINAGVSVHKFENAKSLLGEQEYDFEFTLPEWLPQSFIYCGDHCSSNFKIKYLIWAQILPVNKSDYIDSKKSLSVFRGALDIYITRPQR